MGRNREERDDEQDGREKPRTLTRGEGANRGGRVQPEGNSVKEVVDREFEKTGRTDPTKL